jgi:hypothetical protein
MAGAAAGGLEQPIQVGPWTLRNKFDRTVVSIPNPAAQPKLAGLAHEEVSETNPLDVTADDALQALVFHDWYIVPRMAASSVIAIGDELVGGFTLDSNSHWLAERLRLLGYPVKRITAIRDRPQEIVEQLGRELADPELTHVFVSGGLGLSAASS